MNKSSKIIILSLVVLLLVWGFFSMKDRGAEVPEEEQVFCTMDAKMCPDGSYVGRIPPSCEFAECPAPKADKSDFIKVENPKPNQVVRSPLEISGEARLWYFEGDFQVEIKDANNQTLGVGYVSAQGDWMTTEFVPFKGTLIFTHGATPTGTLILSKNNPSDLRELDDSLSIPIRFAQ